MSCVNTAVGADRWAADCGLGVEPLDRTTVVSLHASRLTEPEIPVSSRSRRGTGITTPPVESVVRPPGVAENPQQANAPQGNVMNFSELSVLASVGLDLALQRIFSGELSVDGERFLAAHVEALDAYQLLWWLQQPEPEAEEGGLAWDRPSGKIVDAIVKASAPPGSGFLLAKSVQLVANEHVRDELILKLLAADPNHQWRLIVDVSGCDVFRAVAQHDVISLGGGACDRPAREPSLGCRPSWLIEEGQHAPMVSMSLLEDRPETWRTVRGLVRIARGTDALAAHALWLVDHLGLLDRVGAPAELLDIAVPTQFELHRDDASSRRRQHARFAVQVVDRWPGKQDETVREWFVQRSLAAVERNVPWGAVWPEIPARFRDDVAVASLASRSPAPWAVRAIANRMTGMAAWEAIFACFARARVIEHAHGQIDETFLGYDIASFGGFARMSSQEAQEVFQAHDVRNDAGWMAALPIPEDADESFDERFVATAAATNVSPVHIADRLRTLPLVPHRAARLVEMGIQTGFLWEWDNGSALARAAGAMPNAKAPSLTHRILARPEAYATYKLLLGSATAKRLLAFFEQHLESDLHSACLAFDADPGVFDEAACRRLRSAVLAGSFASIHYLRQGHPSLEIGDADVADVARGRVDAGEPWRPEFLPECADDAVVDRVRRLADADETVALLDHLAPRRVTRELLAVAQDWLLAHEPSTTMARWIGTKLTSKSLWAEPGTSLVQALLHGSGPALVALLAMSEASSQASSGAVLAAVHDVIGTALAVRARQAFMAGDPRTARRTLTALAHLSPSPRLRSTVRDLRKLDRASEVEVQIEANEMLLRRGRSESPGFAGVVDAITVMARLDVDADDRGT